MANLLLGSLPAAVRARLNDLGSRVRLEKLTVLVKNGMPKTCVYFLDNGLVSLQMTTLEGDAIEVAMVGREGVAALPLAEGAPATAAMVVIVPGEALCVPIDALLTESACTPSLQLALSQQWNRLLAEIATGSACHRFHSRRQRLARWLLTASDRVESSRFELRQSDLALILGLPRTEVTIASVALQHAGAIASRHGMIRILDRARLRSASCECVSIPLTEIRNAAADSPTV